MLRGMGCDCAGSRTLRGLGDAPSWWDNIVNSVSSEADNLWNDAEAAGVWAGNEAQSFWDSMNASPYNPIQAGANLTQSAGLEDIPGQVETGISNVGSEISSAAQTGFNGLLTLGIIGIVAFALIEDRK